MQVWRRRGELDTIAFGERAINLSIHRDATKPTWIVILLNAVLALDPNAILFCVHILDTGIFARLDTQHFAATRIADHISWLVLHGPLPICTGHLLSRVEDPQLVLLVPHVAALLHCAMDESIQLAPRFIIGCDHQRSIGLLSGFVYDFLQPRFTSADLVNCD